MSLEESITVGNVRVDKRTAELVLYCGRGGTPRGMVGTGLGNPYTVEAYGRGTALALYESYLYRLNKDSLQWRMIRRMARRLHEGKTIQLFCWCKPAPCHCDFIRKQVLQICKERYDHV